MNSDHIPEGYHTLTPYFLVPDLSAYLEFLTSAFGAKITERIEKEDGSTMHAEVRIGNSALMIGQQKETSSPQRNMQYVFVPDVDEAYCNLIAEGCFSIQEPEDQLYGHRTAAAKDSIGNDWWLAKKS